MLTDDDDLHAPIDLSKPSSEAVLNKNSSSNIESGMNNEINFAKPPMAPQGSSTRTVQTILKVVGTMR